jgi:RimJ/RimL family protein N-acetyltransferase
VIELPDPPLASGDLVLRPWRADDAPALVAAWTDPEIQRWTGVPPQHDLRAATRWIAGDEARRRRWLSLDLVAERAGEVAGEVGLSSIDREARTADIGWWTAVAHRRQGVARTAVRLVARWAEADLGLTLTATCHPANPASIAVARRAGIAVVEPSGWGSHGRGRVDRDRR